MYQLHAGYSKVSLEKNEKERVVYFRLVTAKCALYSDVIVLSDDNAVHDKDDNHANDDITK